MNNLNTLFSKLSRQLEADRVAMMYNFSARRDDSIRARSVALLQKLANTADELATPNQGAELRSLASRDY